MNVTYFDPAHAHCAEDALASTFKWQYVRVGAAVLTVVLSVVYLLMLNALATQGFDMEGLKAKQLSLYQDLEAVDINLAIPSSLYALESNELIQSMPTVNKKDFVAVDADHVALLSE